MPRIPIRILITDLDRTLLTDEKRIPEYTQTVFEAVRDAGILTAFATARPPHSIRAWQQQLRPDYLIVNNGASIRQGSRELYQAVPPQEELARLVSALLREETVSSLCLNAEECMYTSVHIEPDDGWDAEWLPVFHDFSKGLPKGVFPKFSVECAQPEIILRVLEEYPTLRCQRSFGEPWIMIMHREATKWAAVRRLLDMLDIPPGQAAAFGDDYSDLEMLEHCGHGVAVANAVPEAKATARHVCANNNAQGVAKWIEEFVL